MMRRVKRNTGAVTVFRRPIENILVAGLAGEDEKHALPEQGEPDNLRHHLENYDDIEHRAPYVCVTSTSQPPRWLGRTTTTVHGASATTRSASATRRPISDTPGGDAPIMIWST